MKIIKNVLIFTLLFYVSALFIGCSDNGNAVSGNSSNEVSIKDSSIEAKILEATENAKQIKNYDLTLNMDLKMSSAGQAIDMSTTATGTAFIDPIKMKMDMDISNLPDQKVQMYMEQEGNKLIMYSGMNGTWQKQEMDVDSNSLNQYNVKDNLSLYLENAKNFKEMGIEKVNDKDAYKLVGTVSGESLQKVIDESGSFSSMSSLGINMDDLSSLYDNMGDLPVTVWVEKETLFPVKYEMNLQPMMTEVMKNISKMSNSSGSENLDVEVQTYMTTMTISNINSAKDFQIPEEAKN